MNKFAEKLAAQQTKQPTQPQMSDVEKFIQSAAVDGALTRSPEQFTAPVVAEPVKAVVTPMERLLAQLSEHREDVMSKGKGKAERITISFPKEQLIKAEIIKLLLESEKEMPLAMSQVISILIDRGFDSMMKE